MTTIPHKHKQHRTSGRATVRAGKKHPAAYTLIPVLQAL